MSTSLKIIVWIGAITIVVMCAFPPWSSSVSTSGIRMDEFTEYSFFLKKPKIDVQKVKETDSDSRLALVKKYVSVKIDYKRLFLQIFMILVVVSASMVTIKRT